MKFSDYIKFGAQKLPELLQSEVAECGVTCVAMVACYHGLKTNMLAMRQKYPVGLRGVTVKQITQIGSDIGMNVRVLKLELGQLAKIKKPAILHWDFNHFVTLARVTAKGVVIHDPAKGKVKLDWQQASDSFTGVAIELTPSSEFEQKDEQIKVPLRQFIGKVDGLGKSLGKIFCVAIILQGLILISPYYIRLVIDHGITNSNTSLLVWVLVGFMFVLLLTTAAQIIRAATIMYLDKSLGFQVKANIQRHLLRLPLSFFEARHVGDIKSRFEAFGEVQRLISRGFITAIVDGLLAITTLIIMFSYQPALAMVSLAFLLALFVARLILSGKENEHLEQAISKQAKENSHFIETIRAITPIKAFVKENARISIWLNIFADSINAGIKYEKIQLIAGLLPQVLSKAEYLVLVFVGAQLILQEALTLGMFFAFLAYRQHFSDSAQSITDHLFQFRVAGTYLRRMSDIVMQSAEHDEQEYFLESSQVCGQLEVRDMHFRYSDSTPWLFQGLNFKVAAGEYVVIVGKSGLGKTTLLKLMTGLRQAQQGEILLDGNSLKSIGFRHFRSFCATVMQDDQLLNGSLLENITFFEPSPDLTKVKEVAIGVAIWDDIQAMPMGLHSPVGDLGSALSGGQKQRLLMARALYLEPKILFLDESTSHLDIGTEKQVNAYLEEKQITRISVAHRQETIKSADRVIDLSTLSGTMQAA